MRVLVLGVTGMLGNAVFRLLSERSNLVVYGTARTNDSIHYFSKYLAQQIIAGLDVENHDSLTRAFAMVCPEVVVNCVGLVKQLANANDPLQAISVNALLPHRISALCQVAGARLVHFGTDCVFSGTQGNYLESDFPDATDLYGRSKLLGEVDYPNAITLRTSIVGHELSGHRSLVGWFLAQQGSAKGYVKAIFSGVPTVELAGIVRDFVLPRPDLHGVYHVASKPISKLDLLRLVAEVYGKDIDIIASDDVVIDRSLNAARFNKATGYAPPAWPSLVQRMFAFK
jgi:dTDP-4-dehydrorhamnose reductase